MKTLKQQKIRARPQRHASAVEDSDQDMGAAFLQLVNAAKAGNGNAVGVASTPPAIRSTAIKRDSGKDVTSVQDASAEDHSLIVASALASATTSMQCWAFAPATSVNLIDHVREQTERLKTGDMTDVEEMLYCQAVTLQAVFATTLQNSMTACSTAKRQQEVLALAFKAQAQCRQTLETLGNIKFPRATTFVRQANIANGPQQVNNNTGTESESHAVSRDVTQRHDNSASAAKTTADSGEPTPVARRARRLGSHGNAVARRAHGKSEGDSEQNEVSGTGGK